MDLSLIDATRCPLVVVVDEAGQMRATSCYGGHPEAVVSVARQALQAIIDNPAAAAAAPVPAPATDGPPSAPTGADGAPLAPEVSP